MTSNSGPRKKRKYNPLNKHGTAVTRKDYIEADYVNGVVNERGEEVMRPLDAYETEWLSQFYSETEHDNFAKTKESEEAQEIYNVICTTLRGAKKNKLSTERVLELKDEAEKAYKKLVQLRCETNTFYPEDKDRREIYSKGNKRRNDIFNVAKASGKLISYDVPEFDKFSSQAEKDINPEHLVLDYLTKKPVKKKKEATVIVRKKGR